MTYFLIQKLGMVKYELSDHKKEIIQKIKSSYYIAILGKKKGGATTIYKGLMSYKCVNKALLQTDLLPQRLNVHS